MDNNMNNQQDMTQPVQGYQQQGGYAQPMQGYQQQGGYAQPMQGYQQQMQYQQPNQAMTNLMKNAKDVKNDFTNKVKKMGLSTWCLLGIIGAMLLIVAPFMNFATIHLKQSYKEDGIKLEVKAADGLNMFELSKLSNTVDKLIKENNRLVKKYGRDEMEREEFYEEIEDMEYLSQEILSEIRYSEKIDKDDLIDALDDLDDILDYVEEETDLDIESTYYEAKGILKLVLKGKLALAIAPWFIILSGIGLLIFTVINNKKLKLVFSAIPAVFLIWLMASSTSFFTMMGIGALALIAGVVLGLVSAIKELPSYN